jgi:polar amino acid transport system substrate-binding protein
MSMANIFRHIAVTLFLSYACLAMAAPPQTTHRIGQEIQQIIERGYIVVAMPAVDSPPFFFERAGKMMGLDVELVSGLAKDLGVEVRYNRTGKSFNDAVNLVASGEADIAWCKLSRTMGRAKIVNFSKPYLTLHHSLAINRVRFADLSKKERHTPSIIRNYQDTLAVIEGSSFVGYAKQYFPKAKLVEMNNFRDVVHAVRSGKVTAAYRDDFEIKRLIKIDPTISLNVRTVTLTDIEDTLGVAVRPADIQLLAFINLYLDKQTEKLTVDKILAKHEKWLQ